MDSGLPVEGFESAFAAGRATAGEEVPVFDFCVAASSTGSPGGGAGECGDGALGAAGGEAGWGGVAGGVDAYVFEAHGGRMEIGREM